MPQRQLTWGGGLIITEQAMLPGITHVVYWRNRHDEPTSLLMNNPSTSSRISRGCGRTGELEKYGGWTGETAVGANKISLGC